MSTTIKRGISFLLGLILLSLGISFTILSGLGAGAWDALAVGLADLSGFTVGTWVILNGIVLIFINAFLLQKKPEIISLVTVIIIGYFIDFWLINVFKNFHVELVIVKYVILITGVLLMGLGISTYLQGKFAVIPIDRFMMAIQKRLKVSLGVGKTIAELTALVVAFIVGGPIGIGTVIVTLSIGPMVQLCFPRIEKGRLRCSLKNFSTNG